MSGAGFFAGTTSPASTMNRFAVGSPTTWVNTASTDGLAEVDFALEIPFVRLKAVEGLPTMIAKFTTDIPQLSNWGEPLLLGPGSIHVAHTPRERIAKSELLQAVELYIKVAKQLLG